ncbi:Alpha/beta hydrolase family protein [Rosistilla ulvae]|uniref:Alpha/beta hydrolase family protein n=1 Tax=Rosistilla ulvae TaxID=1930277 RepID=A0A517M7M8_9BACT|nr:alpha/beta hydrolase family protein [Rosistilla ulvae]QDS90892.1 Alpha/beta hydrolase family protein [Rosistilla ulvae]
MKSVPPALLLVLGIFGTATADESIQTRSLKPAAQTPTATSNLQWSNDPERRLVSWPQDPAAAMVAGIDRFLLHQLDAAAQSRPQHWRDADSVAKNVRFLSQQLGLEPQRYPSDLQWDSPPQLRSDRFEVHAVRWPVLSHPAPPSVVEPGTPAGLQLQPSLWGEGLLWLPRQANGSSVVMLSHDGEPSLWSDPIAVDQRVRCEALAAQGFTVLEVATTGHDRIQHGGAKLPRREFLNRTAFELGRTLVGYEIQTVQSAIDWLAQQPAATEVADAKITLAGWGEGGRTALLCGVLEPRIDLTIVAGYFGPRDLVWQEPADRNVFGLQNRFADAELAVAIAPRKLVVQTEPRFTLEESGDAGAAPAQWQSPSREEAQREFDRIASVLAGIGQPAGTPPHAKLISDETSDLLNDIICPSLKLPVPPAVAVKYAKTEANGTEASDDRTAIDRRARRLAMIDRYNQELLEESEYERGKFMNLGHSRTIANNAHNKLDTSSPAAYEKSVERFRQIFRQEVVGWYDQPRLAANARSMPTHQGEGWTGHDVVLDVFPDVFAYGVLLVPDNIPAGEQRPVVVCQHGLEGQPRDTFADNHRAYHDYAAKLAEAGYIVFAPQNPYKGKDAFRTLQRKSYPVGKTLFSIIASQHQQLLDWLKTIPSVDPQRIAFYGLSYGGKSAMRLPALLPDYCLSICSADFNDWIWKNASTRARYSYIGTGEYEIYEFGLGKTFNYAEMAALIAPRPFMVERGHYDGVGPDDRVAKEFAKARFLYAARLKMPERCEIEWFDGPHMINAVGSFEFLDRHLRSGGDTPQPSEN